MSGEPTAAELLAGFGKLYAEHLEWALEAFLSQVTHEQKVRAIKQLLLANWRPGVDE